MTVYLIKYLPTTRHVTPHYFAMTAASAADAVRDFCGIYVTPPVVLDVYGPPLAPSEWAGAGVNG
ncbi:hypothetical protein [Amycolatopsis kentuckyensis]|uniref:hypothetical protein n=1 Tax=Amycolatopsis kentuckyensis TaxID=218823 RepID=UPI00356AD7AB